MIAHLRVLLPVLLLAAASGYSTELRAQEAATPAPQIKLTAVADRSDAQYKPGETVTFTIDARQGDKPLEQGEIVCVLSQDGWKPLSPQTVTVKDGKATITGTLDKPGFLLLRARIGQANVLAGAAFSPLEIKPSADVPDDFDQFWAAQKTELAKVPANPVLTPAKAPAKGIEAFDLKVDCIGQPVSGYFGKPTDAKPKSLPAILFVHGAGVRSSGLNSTGWALKNGGMLTLDINAHGIENGQPASFYDELNKGSLKDYRAIGRQDRDKSYFKGMFLRLIRAIDFLTAQPEWDGKTLIVYGSSQGGFQAFAAAGLDSRVSFICAGVPAGCDHTGSLADRISGWPKLVTMDQQGKPDPLALQASRYFDCVNFATRATCKGAAVTVGYIDQTCPPTSIYAAYNALPITKAIHVDVDAGHTNTPAASKFMEAAANEHVRAMKEAASAK